MRPHGNDVQRDVPSAIRGERDLSLGFGTGTRRIFVGARGGAVHADVVLRVYHVRRIRAVSPRVLGRQRTVDLFRF